VVAAGGDGTSSTVAQHLVGTPGVLGVLPAGTLNHFARDIGVADHDVALGVLARGRPRAVDVGRAGDRHFLNNAVVGLYPEAVEERGRVQHRVGKWPGLALGWLEVLARAIPLTGTVRPRSFGWGRLVRRDAVSAIVELRKARPFALDGELQSPVPVLAVRVVPRALNVLVEGGET
jgi:diacylglycerol kinase family enzyme